MGPGLANLGTGLGVAVCLIQIPRFLGFESGATDMRACAQQHLLLSVDLFSFERMTNKGRKGREEISNRR